MKNCDDWMEAISSRADNQPIEVTTAEIDRHIALCPACSTYAEFLHRLKRKGLAEAPSLPDLSPQVVKSVQLKEGRTLWTGSRAILAVCAGEVLFFSIDDLLTSSHEARHLGAFSAAIGIAFMMVALRPTRARMMLPVTVILGLTLALGAVFDVVGGQIPLLTEARHIPELISIVMIWILARPVRVVAKSSSNKTTSWVPRVVADHEIERGEQRG